MCFNKDKGTTNQESYVMARPRNVGVRASGDGAQSVGAPSIREPRPKNDLMRKEWEKEREDSKKELKKSGKPEFGRTLSSGNVDRSFDNQAIDEAMNPGVYSSKARVGKWMENVQEGGSEGEQKAGDDGKGASA